MNTERWHPSAAVLEEDEQDFYEVYEVGSEELEKFWCLQLSKDHNSVNFCCRQKS